MAAQNEELLRCAENVEKCPDVHRAIATFQILHNLNLDFKFHGIKNLNCQRMQQNVFRFAYSLQQFKQAILKGGKETMQLLEEQSTIFSKFSKGDVSSLSKPNSIGKI